MLNYPFQLQSIAISKELRQFFQEILSSSIEFWDCHSKVKWPLHLSVDQDTRRFKLDPIYPCKMLQDYSKKKESDDYISNWQTTFYMMKLKGRQFLNLMDNNFENIVPTYIKGGLQLNYLGLSNILCTRAMRAITNHTLISKYRLRFFPDQDFSCPCSKYPIKSRQCTLHECKRFNNYQNPRKNSLGHFVSFLDHNSNAFSFAGSMSL